ncbi:CHAT domain-containing protein [Fulvivirgaceae bacterium PWU4]|uniref:CHAT domain-containing protein n=1 Tax=Chryseosolibacter histidini TaxID=2782349 RepID=A0AAP2DPG7_9BACT|nr:CHAT domain-containing protein [Chryseosolibacter histidini]MBT1700156.1 CHAT domain-containing protein [Chryseosolibacter histidini]
MKFAWPGIPSLGSEDIDVALDGVWLADVGQGNVHKASHLLREWGKTEKTADRDFAAAWIDLLSSNFRKALDAFKRSFENESSPEKRFIIASSANYCLVASRVLPDGRWVDFTEANDANHINKVTEWRGHFESLAALALPDEERFIGLYIGCFRTNFPKVIGTLMQLRRAGSFPVPPAHAIAPLKLKELFDLHSRTDFPLIFNFMLLKLAELYGVWGNLDNIDAYITEIGDQLGGAYRAVAVFYRGRLRISQGKVGFPELFGCIPSNAMQMAFASLLAVKPPIAAAADLELALADFEASHTFFDRLDSPRAKAQIEICIAYLYAVKSEFNEATRYYNDAQSNAAKVNDIRLQYTAYAGRVLTGIFSRAPELDIVNAAQCISDFFYSRELPASAMAFGIALSETSLEVLNRGFVDQALQCLLMAEEIILPFRPPLQLCRISVARAHIYATINAYSRARIELDKSVNWIQLADKSAPLQTAHHKLIRYFVALNVAVKEQDADQLERDFLELQVVKSTLPQVSEEECERLGKLILVGIQAEEELNRDTSVSSPTDLNKKVVEAFSVLEKGSACEFHKLCRSLESSYALLIPWYKALGHQRVEEPEQAEIQFRKVLDVAKKRNDGDYIEAMVFSEQKKFNETVHALNRYAHRNYPDTQELVSILSAGNHRSVDSRRRQVAQIFANIEAWDLAAAEYAKSNYVAPDIETMAADMDPGMLVDALNHARIFEHNKQYKEAKNSYKNLLAAIEYKRSQFFDEYLQLSFGGEAIIYLIYGEYCRYFIGQGDWRNAHYISELGRARTLTEYIDRRVRSSSTDDLSNTYHTQATKVERLIQQRTIASRQADVPVQRIEDMLSSIKKETSLLRDLEAKVYDRTGRPNPQLPAELIASVDECAKRLPDETLMLCYFYYRSYFYGWAIDRTGIAGTFSTNEIQGWGFNHKTFDHRVSEWIAQLADGKSETEGKAWGSLLSQLLLEPFRNLITAAKSILFIPYGVLNLAPLQALPWHKTYLGREKIVSYLPASTLLKFLKPFNYSQNLSGLVVGDPDDMKILNEVTGDFSNQFQLPSAGLEALVIGMESDFTILIAEEATEAVVKREWSSDTNIVHIAAHGWFQHGASLQSGIVLAAGGYLSVDDLMSMNVDSRIVILSACDTGKSELKGSDIVGIVRGLLCAGASAIVVSMTPAYDVAGTLLMIQLHRNLRHQHPLGKALLLAQQWLSSITAAEALDFLHEIGTFLVAKNKLSADIEARLLICEGDIHILTGKFTAMRKCYRRAAALWFSIGKSKMSDETNATLRGHDFREDYPDAGERYATAIFSDVRYWANFSVIGHWF